MIEEVSVPSGYKHRIHVLYSTKGGHEEIIREISQIQASIDVRLLMPHQFDEDIKLLIVPDLKGYNTTSMAFFPHYRIVPMYPPMDNLAAWFFQFTFELILAKRGNKRPVSFIGFGDGGCAILDKLYERKLFLDGNRLKPVDTEYLNVYGKDIWYEDLGNGFVMEKFVHSDAFLERILTMSSIDDESDNSGGIDLVPVPVLVPVTPAPRPPSLHK